MENPYSEKARRRFLRKFVLYTFLAIPGTVIGLLLTLTIVLAIIGIPLMLLSIRPLALLNKRRVAAIVAWDFAQVEKSKFGPEPKRPWLN